jgi:hypothetical protein
MDQRNRPTSRRTRASLLLAALAAILLAAGCGSSSSSSTTTAAAPGLTISGPGLQTSLPATPPKPAWPPEYEHLAERLRLIGIPPGGQEKFHIHAMLHIYVNGLLAPLAAQIGLDPSKGVESSMHTHDSTGIIHMEAPHPFRYTLGDFFAVWGVALGPEQVGGLKGLGGNHLHFFVNGKPFTNPAALVLHRYDSVVIGYGPEGSFPHMPSTFLLKEVEKGEGGLGCGKAHKGQKSKGCVAMNKARENAQQKH